MGRPKIEITDEQLTQITRLAKIGISLGEIAYVIGISERTLRRKKDQPRVMSAIKTGQAQANHRVGRALYKKAVRGDVTACIWWEKTRAGRSEKVITQHEGKDVEISIGRASAEPEAQHLSPRRPARSPGGLKAV